MRIIAITGMPGSGKNTIRKLLQKKGLPVVVMRHVVEDELREKGIEPTNTSLREYATELRQNFGYDIIARRSLERARKLCSENVVMDGIRGDMEIDFFRSQPDVDFVLIAVEASAEIRFERLKKRGFQWDMKTREEFDYRDSKELGWGIGKAIEMADYRILNDGSFDDFIKEAEKAVNEILRLS